MEAVLPIEIWIPSLRIQIDKDLTDSEKLPALLAQKNSWMRKAYVPLSMPKFTKNVSVEPMIRRS